MASKFKLDWLEFSWTTNTFTKVGGILEAGLSLWENFKLIFPEFLPLIEECFLAEYNLQGYDNVLCLSDEIKFCYSSSEPTMGIHVVIPAHGLYRLGEVFNLESVEDFYLTQSLFSTLLDRGVRFTRIDLCYDDYNKRITPFQWNELASLGQVECKARSRSYIASCHQKGDTVYFGKRSGGRMLRIYDKEYESKGEIKAIRYEFELKRDYAIVISEAIRDGVVIDFRNLMEMFLKVYNELKHLPDDVSRTQLLRDREVAGILEAWNDLLNDMNNYSQNAECVSISKQKSTPTFDAKLRWYQDSARSLSMVRDCIGITEFMKFLDEGRRRYTDQDLSIIKVYREYHGYM